MSILFREKLIDKHPVAFAIFVWIMVELTYWIIEGKSYLEHAQMEPIKFGIVLIIKLLIFVALTFLFLKWKRPKANISQ